MRTSLATILRDIAEADMPISEIARYAHILSPEVIHYESDHDHLFFFPDGTSTAIRCPRRRGEPDKCRDLAAFHISWMRVYGTLDPTLSDRGFPAPEPAL